MNVAKADAAQPCIACGRPTIVLTRRASGELYAQCMQCYQKALDEVVEQPTDPARQAASKSITAEAARMQKEQKQAIELATVRADRVKPERVRWVWPGRVPAGKVTVVDGDPGLGKSTFTLDLAARLTTASPLPDGHRPEEPMAVMVLSAEDGAADTIVPRLHAAGAKLELVTIIDHVTDQGGPRPVELPADAGCLEDWCKGYMYTETDADDAAVVDAGLVVVDPLMAYLGGEVNAHRDQDVRRALHPLKLLAERTGVAVLVVRHLNKMTGSSALYRGGGSIGIIGAARAGLLVGVDPEDPDRRILAVSKSNLAAKPPSLAYRLVEDELYSTAKVVWEGTSERTAEDLVGRPLGRPSPQQDEAEAFVRAELAGGPRRVADLRSSAEKLGLSWRTVQRAAEALEVETEQRPVPGKRGPGPSWWSLPNARQEMRATTNHTPSGAHSVAENPQVSEPEEAPNGMRASAPSLFDDHDPDDPRRFTR